MMSEMAIYYFLTFLLGLFVGSFLNLVSDRLEKGGKITSGRSHCEFCKKELSAKELIPLLSFILQGGKCKNCGHELSLLYPVSELLTGSLFVSLALWIGIFENGSFFEWLSFLYYVLISCFFIVIFLSDVKFMLVPDKVVFPAIAISLIFNVVFIVLSSFLLYRELVSYEFGTYLIKAGFWQDRTVSYILDFLPSVASAFGISLFFLFLIYITKGRGMGGGDVKLGFLIGLVNGFPSAILAIFMSFFAGAAFSIVLVFLKRKTIKDVVPFGPFLILGSYLALFFGERLLELYLGAL